MKSIWICAVLLCLAYTVQATENKAPNTKYEDDEYYEDWYEDVNQLETDIKDNEDVELKEDNLDYPDDTLKDAASDFEHDKQVVEEIQENLEGLDALKSLDDYQYEDNRFEIKENANDRASEEKQAVENIEEIIDDTQDQIQNTDTQENIDEYDDHVLNEYDTDNKGAQDLLNENAAEEESNDDSIIDEVPEPVKNRKTDDEDSKKQIFEDTKKLLEETDSAFEDVEDDLNHSMKKINDNVNGKPEKPIPIDDVKIINEHDVEKLDVEPFSDDDDKKSLANNENKSEDKNTNAQNSDKEEKAAEVVEDVQNLEVPELENEKESEKQIQDLINEVNDAKNSADDDNQENNDDYEKIEDSNLDEIFSSNKVENDGEDFDILNVNVDEIGKILEEKSIAQEVLRKESQASEDGEKTPNEDEKSIPKEELRDTAATTTTTTTTANQEQDVKKEALNDNEISTTAAQNVIANPTTLNIDDLTSAELENLIEDFAKLHEDEIEADVKDSTPIHREIDPDTPVEVTSPNYPANYPTNNIVEWILYGDGRGIELNITDFAVNGALGDYVLIKPGGMETGAEDSIIFSYRLNSERRYRFVDANSLYIKFESKPGMSFFNGFRFSIKMIRPPPPILEEKEPEPDQQLPEVVHSHEVYLQGLTLVEFQAIREDFRQIIADMATMYIVDMNIPFGFNKTLETTQIVREGLCKKTWEGFERCVYVRFGVPLVYDEDLQDSRLNETDLENMWTRYSNADPFYSLLQRLGLEEYPNPDDDSVLVSWMMVAFGVIFLAALVSLCLWRFSCFENYTRMPVYSDTDSIQNEKRGLDLYPTPHQTLPPLYADQEYPWEKYTDDTRVDMGGFTNSSFVREDMFNIDSDEEVVQHKPRDRYTTDV